MDPNVTLILSRYGEQILNHMAEYCQPGFLEEKHQTTCIHGEELMLNLFNPKKHRGVRVSTYRHSNIHDITEGHVYFCHIVFTCNAEEQYISEQQHPFCIIYDRLPLIIQSFGGVPGLSVRVIAGNLQELLGKIIDGDSETAIKFFDLPKDNELVEAIASGFEVDSFLYNQHPIKSIGIDRLRSVMVKIGATEVIDKIDRLI